MFPQTFSSVLMIVGAIWVVQGLGVADTGSFMDGRPLWAILGAAAFLAGLVLLLLRRRNQKEQVDQPDS